MSQTLSLSNYVMTPLHPLKLEQLLGMFKSMYIEIFMYRTIDARGSKTMLYQQSLPYD